MADQIYPTFFIGLGGTGGKTVNRIARKFKTNWNYETLRNSVAFFTFDTDRSDLEGFSDIPKENRFLLHIPRKKEFVDRVRGAGYLDPDPFYTSWMHPDYGFHIEGGKGAGQIRIESRLTFTYRIEHPDLQLGHRDILRAFQDAIGRALDPDNNATRRQPAYFQIFCFGSIAGGTGSGSFLPLAYTLQHLLQERGWETITALCLFDPEVFEPEVQNALKKDIQANGYAALMETDHFMRLSAEGGHHSLPKKIRFHTRKAWPRLVDRAPATIVYLCGIPKHFSMEKIASMINAVADASYFQVFSPLLGLQEAESVNFVRHQLGLVQQVFSAHYGAFGCCLLHVPDEDILLYCGLRFAETALRRYVLLEGEVELLEGEGEENLSEEEKADAEDERFCFWIDRKAEEEVRDRKREGIFQKIRGGRLPSGETLQEVIEAAVAETLQEIPQAIRLSRLSTNDLSEYRYGLDPYRNRLVEELAESKARLQRHLRTVTYDIANGTFLGRIFKGCQADPFMQRYALIDLKRRLRTAISDGQEPRNPDDPTASAVIDRLRSWEDELARTAPYTMKERLFQRENRDFIETREQAVADFNRVVEANQRAMEAHAKREIEEALFHQVMERLRAFRTLMSLGKALVEELEEEADRFQRSGVPPEGESQANAFFLDEEALQDLEGNRLWKTFYEAEIVPKEVELFQPAEIFAAIEEASAPRLDPRGRTQSPTPEEVRRALKAKLVQLGCKRLRPRIVGMERNVAPRDQQGLLIDEALLLEARFVLEKRQKAGEILSFGPDEIAAYIREKLGHAKRRSGHLAKIENLEDPEVKPCPISLVAFHECYQEALPHQNGSLADHLREISPEGRWVENWHDRKRIVFYQATLGVPLFYFPYVRKTLRQAYEELDAKGVKERGYPLHIDAAFEKRLCPLTPERLQEFLARSLEERVAPRFVLGTLAGIVSHQDGAYHWKFGERWGDTLGSDLSQALRTYDALEPAIAERISRKLEETERRLKSDPQLRTALEALRTTYEEAILDRKFPKRQLQDAQTARIDEIPILEKLKSACEDLLQSTSA